MIKIKWVFILVSSDILILASIQKYIPHILRGDRALYPIFDSVIASIFALILFLAMCKQYYPSKVITILLLSGCLSNLFAKIIFGKVLDYIPLGFVYTNTADLMIGSGALLFMLSIYSRSSEAEK